MTYQYQSSIDIATEDDIRIAQNHARAIAHRGELGKRDENRLTTIVSELTRNLIKYAGQGTCELDLQFVIGGARVRCICRDQGAGIDDVDAALTDGYSTGATLGVGLPGVKRLADTFHIESSTQGTVIIIELYSRIARQNRPNSLKSDPTNKTDNDFTRAGVSIRPFKLGRFSGDQAGVWFDKKTIMVCMVDGLGHGEEAEYASRKVVRFVEKNRSMDLINLMRDCNEELRGSRGVAMAVVRIDVESGDMEFIGVGNTRCVIVGRNFLYLGSVTGVVGKGSPSPLVQQHTLGQGDVIMFWTDGLPETLSMVTTRVRRTTNLQAFADQLIDRYAIEEDDAGIVVVRWDA
jgi:anti-sigma regulatory factor (Ser/Thr protein kinase)